MSREELKSISPLSLDSIASPTLSIKTPSTGSLKDYLKYELFKNIEESLGDNKIKKSRNIGQISETNPVSKYSELNQKILEIAQRDLNLTQDPNNINSSINNVRASLICYQKNNFDSLTEIKITPTDIPTKEIQKVIIEHEKASIRKSLELRSIQLGYKILEQPEEMIDKKQKYESCKSMFLELKSQISVFDANARILSNNDPEEIKKFLTRNRIACDSNDLETLKDTMSHFLNDKINQVLDKCVELFPAEEPSEELNNKEKLKHYRKLFSDFKEGAKKDNDYTSFINDLKVIEKEQEICELLLEDASSFEDAIIKERGHSEDYLYYALLDPESLANIKNQIPENANRFYFVISSTRDSCDRCSKKMEELVELFKDHFNRSFEDKKISADDDDVEDQIDCKLLYFANKPMTRRKNSENCIRDYEESLDNLSDVEEDVINVMPNIYCKEDVFTFGRNRKMSDLSEKMSDLSEIDSFEIIANEDFKPISEETQSPKTKTKSRSGSPERLFENIPLNKSSTK